MGLKNGECQHQSLFFSTLLEMHENRAGTGEFAGCLEDKA
jgi:hypothetical protein